jgi:hypothetical protein
MARRDEGLCHELRDSRSHNPEPMCRCQQASSSPGVPNLAPAHGVLRPEPELCVLHHARHGELICPQTAFCAKTLRVAGLLSFPSVSSVGTARFGVHVSPAPAPHASRITPLLHHSIAPESPRHSTPCNFQPGSWRRSAGTTQRKIIPTRNARPLTQRTADFRPLQVDSRFGGHWHARCPPSNHLSLFVPQ